MIADGLYRALRADTAVAAALSRITARRGN
jgi:hypothetical protein